MKHDTLGDRMKSYENVTRNFLTRRTPVIIRLDGKAFHTFTRGCAKPFDMDIIKTMEATAKYLHDNIQGAKVTYCQSDEISILLTDFDTLDTDAWFGNNIQKMCSISAAMASVKFSNYYSWKKFDPSEDVSIRKDYIAHFDSRCFNIPKEEVMNVFRWRYQDWLRNSIQMLAQSLYSQKELHGKKSPALHELCFQKGKNWNDLDPQLKNGTLFVGDKTYYDFNLNSNEFCDSIFKEILYDERAN